MSRRSRTISFVVTTRSFASRKPRMSASGRSAGVRRVARPLEPVVLEAPDRVDVAELVDEEDAAAGPGHAGELRDDELGPVRVVQDAKATDEVEVAVRERQRLRVVGDERAVRRQRLPGAAAT